MRCFLALPLPLRLRTELAALARTCDGLAAQDETTIHLTIRFLGELEEAAADALCDALAPAVAAVPAFELELRGLGTFPERGRARVLWAGIGAGAGEAAALAAAVEQGVRGRGLPAATRPFHPHVTLGRFRPPRPPPPLPRDPGGKSGRFPAERLILYESRLSPPGARHFARRELSLRAGM